MTSQKINDTTAKPPRGPKQGAKPLPGADREGRGPETGPDSEMEVEVKPPGRKPASTGLGKET